MADRFRGTTALSSWSFGGLFILCVVAFFLTGASAEAGVYRLSAGEAVIGSIGHYTVKEGESLIEIARKFGLGYQEVAEANPDLDPFVPGAGAAVVLPSSFILPDDDGARGIVINLSELRLYYFFAIGDKRFVRVYPIGIGRQGDNTPTGDFSVVEKIANPSWHVPESIRLEKPELPKVVPPGPDNPLGSYAMRLSRGDILIHGTNRPWGVGRRVSHGCIRLYPENIPELFDRVPKGTRVRILRQPVKVGMKDNRVYLEVHRDGCAMNLFDEAVRLLNSKGLIKYVSTERVYHGLEESNGLPVDISD